MMERLAQLLRASLRHTSESMVTLEQELTFLDDYLAIESARFEGRITVSVQAADDLLSFARARLSTPAFGRECYPTRRLQASDRRPCCSPPPAREGQTLRLRVQDNGVGLPCQWEFPRDAGLGLRNIASRLGHLYGRSNLLQIAPVLPEGVEVIVEVPLEPKP